MLPDPEGRWESYPNVYRSQNALQSLVQARDHRKPYPDAGRFHLTSLQFCCAGWALTRGRELSGERPRTLI